MRGISPLVASKLLYFDVMRGILVSLSSHRIHFISTQRGGYPFSSRRNVLFRRDKGGISLSCQIHSISTRQEGISSLVASNLFHFDAMRGDIPLVALNPFHFDAMRGISFSLRRIHSISTRRGGISPLVALNLSFPPSPRVESQNPPNLGGFCATLLMSRRDGGGFPPSPPFQTRPWARRLAF